VIVFESLDPQSAAGWEDMTYPAFRDLLGPRPANGSFAAIAAREAAQPVGLGLGRLDQGSTGEILSVFVARPWRGRGIGTALLERMEEEIRALGATRVEATYSSSAPAVCAVESLLRRRGWSPPEVRMLIGTANAGMLQAPWMQRSPPDGGLSLFRWSDLSAGEREALLVDARRMGEEAFGGLPLADSESFEPINSIGLRDGHRVVGWLLTHRIAPATIRYTHLYLESRHRAFGQAFRLLSEGIRRQAAVLGEESQAIFGVWARNHRMVRLIRHRLGPYLASLAETRGSFKQCP
jgi:GNAT superfamily N-acetyltransferase